MKKDFLPKVSHPENFHRQAEEGREKGEFLEALKNFEVALVGFQEQGNYAKFAEALQGRFLTYKHLFFLTHDPVYAILGRQDAQASLEISKAHQLKDKYSSGHFRLGEAANLFGDFREAAENFEKAVAEYPGEGAERGDFRYHWGEALYRSGEKESGQKIMLEGFQEIETNVDNRDSFLIHVWASGCLLKLAELLREDNPSAAREYLQKAREIIEADERLVIRKRQLAELSQTFEDKGS